MSLVLRFCGLLALCFAAHFTVAAPSGTYEPKPYAHVQHPSWARNATLYQINLRQFTPEGTLHAAEARLPRLRALGVDILWLMPIHPIGERQRKGSLGSPYAVRDYRAVNPELGTLADLRHFVGAAHDQGLHVILDWVGNHTAWDNVLVASHPDWYDRDEDGHFRPTPWYDWDDIIDLDYRQPGLRRYMTQSLLYWVREAGVDGYRVDAAGLSPLDFWEPVSYTHLSAFAHLWHTVAVKRHLHAFLITALLTTGGFMIMPFASAFSVNNVGIDLKHLPIVYLVTGISTMFVAPMVGRLTDRFSPLPVFLTGSAITIAMVTLYTRLGPSSLATLVVVNVILFAGIFSRMVPWQVVVAGIPAPEQRGAFTAINAALQQLAGGLAALVSGHIVTIAADGKLEHFPWVGNVLIATTLVCCALLWQLQKNAPRKSPR